MPSARNSAPATLSRRAAALAKRQAAATAAVAQGLPAPRQGDNLRTAPLVPCPFCGKALHQGAPCASHLRACVANPDLFAAVRAKLDDGHGGIVRPGSYNLVRGKLPSAGSLRSQVTPGSWPAVAARFGLVAPDGKMMALDHAVAAAGAELDAARAVYLAAAEDEREREWRAGLREGVAVLEARVTVTERVYALGDGRGLKVTETRYTLR